MPDGPAPPDDPYRLPRTVAPVTYRLTLRPDLHAATFTGEVEVDLAVAEATDTVVCNAADLEVTDATVTTADGRRLDAACRLDPDRERVAFALDEALAPGPATLRCRFAGTLNDKLRGFYRSTFADDRGETHTIATTQLQAADARRAFPCWDEPDRKAVFEVTLEVEGGLAAFSNTAVRHEEEAPGGRRLVSFAPTMKMSTYLVAFIVGPLEATEPVDVDGVPVRVVHVPGKAGLSAFALENAAHALRFFTAYFDIPYPGDKLDLVAIPDFAYGAMENVGCVTFRENALLVDPGSAARVELERVADVVAHELAHMWFGDLVTMGWWEGFWLNEAFATFMELRCVDDFRPSWHRWLTFGTQREIAMGVDGLHTTRPIEFPVRSPAEAESMADTLTYQKGAGVLRMLEQYLGPDTFREGIRRYLRRHAYANTVTADLWDALAEASGEPVREVMDSWILQGGHPMVTLTGGPAGGAAELRQSPFAYRDRPAAGDGDSAIGARWQVPVLLRTLPPGAAGAPGRTTRALVTGDTVAVELPAGVTVLNAGGWGLYRSGYSPDQLDALSARLGELDPLERALLYTDAWALVLAGRGDLRDFLSLAGQLGDDPEPTTWAVVVRALALCDRVAGPADRPAVAAVARALLGPRFAAVGFDAADGEDERTPSLRAGLLHALGTFGADPAVRAEAARRLDAAAAGGPPVPADIEGAVLAAVAWMGRPGDYDTVLDRFRAPATPQEEQRYLFALAEFGDPDLAAQTVELALGEVRSQSAPYLLGRLLTQRDAGPAAWVLLEDAWDRALARYPLSSHNRMLEGASALCADPAFAGRVSAFLAAHPIEVGTRQVAQIRERLAVNVAFGERHRPVIGELMAGVVPRA